MVQPLSRVVTLFVLFAHASILAPPAQAHKKPIHQAMTDDACEVRLAGAPFTSGSLPSGAEAVRGCPCPRPSTLDERLATSCRQPDGRDSGFERGRRDRGYGRPLPQRVEIMSEARLASVELIVVSDGSTDRTPEIAQSFAECQGHRLRENQGYGAAIKEGFPDKAMAALVGFLDADGTCDPLLLRATSAASPCGQGADVVLGLAPGAWHEDAEDPASSATASTRCCWASCAAGSVTDTASGMRVMRRSSLLSISTRCPTACTSRPR